jgi:hypothetical protein
MLQREAVNDDWHHPQMVELSCCAWWVRGCGGVREKVEQTLAFEMPSRRPWSRPCLPAQPAFFAWYWPPPCPFTLLFCVAAADHEARRFSPRGVARAFPEVEGGRQKKNWFSPASA